MSGIVQQKDIALVVMEQEETPKPVEEETEDQTEEKPNED